MTVMMAGMYLGESPPLERVIARKLLVCMSCRSNNNRGSKVRWRHTMELLKPVMSVMIKEVWLIIKKKHPKGSTV